MRIRCLTRTAAGAAAIAITFGGLLSADPSSADGRCVPPPGVFGVPYARGDVRVYETNEGNVACHQAAGRLVEIVNGGGLIIASYASAGHYLAYAGAQDDFGHTFLIGSVDLFTGRRAHRLVYRPQIGAAGPIVVKANGSIAWIQGEADFPAMVRLADRRGVRIPPGGGRVTPNTLRLRGSKLTWKRGRRFYSTTLY